MPKTTAPHLVAAGLSPRQLRGENRPRQAAPAAAPPAVPSEKWKQAYEGVCRGRSDPEIVRLYTVPLEVVQTVRSEVTALRAKLANDAPVAWDAQEPSLPGDETDPVTP